MISEPKISTGLIAMLQEVLDRPIAFHRSFVKLTGSITAALMLSQAMYWSKRTNSNDEGWFYKTKEQWEEETGLSRYEQENARKILRGFSFWEEKLRGVPAQMYYRIDISALSNEIILVAGPRMSKNQNKNARLLETSKLDGGNPANKNAENQQTSMLETGKHYKGISENTTETIKTTTPALQKSEFLASGESGSRLFVEKLLCGTMLQGADPRRIVNIAKKYGRTQDHIEKAIDVLDQQYRQSVCKIDDPTALVVSAIKNGIDLPETYIPKAKRQTESEQGRGYVKKGKADESSVNAIETRAYEAAEAKLVVLPEKEREELYSKAKLLLSPFLHSSKIAVKTKALEMMIASGKLFKQE